MENSIRLADSVIRIKCLYSSTYDFLKDYSSDDDPDFSIEIKRGDILQEREKSRLQNISEGKTIINYSERYLETLAVYRKICEMLPLYDTILFHGSLIEFDDTGVLFTALSGTGKSTHTRLWKQLYGERIKIINDDKPLITIRNEVTAYGTPWAGKHHLNLNESCRLKALVLLERCKDNWIKEVSHDEVYSGLINQLYRPDDVQAYLKSLELFDELLKKVRLFRLGCNMDISAAAVASEAIMNAVKEK